jgi:sialate O-acetylesterase
MNKLLDVLAWLVGSLLLVTNTTSYADISLPQLISNGMVLQRNHALKIWGWANVDESVTVSFDRKTYRATTGADRKWTVDLPALKAGGPFTMTIEGKNKLLLTDILIGDVWVCSGQSNMELPMIRVIDRYADVIDQANYPQIRQFNVTTRYNFTAPQEDIPTTRWESVTPQSVLQFTAVGFFFAKALYEKYHVPIGLIKASVGGSPAEAWLSEDALKAFPDYLAIAHTLKDSAYVNQIRRTDETTSKAWYTRIWQQDKGMHDTKPWFDPAYNASAWPTMPMPGYWADHGQPVNGVVWLRKDIDIPTSMAGQPARLRLGTIVDRDSVYLNGVFAGTTGYQYPPRKYNLPPSLLKAGKNTLVVRVINSAGRGGFTKDKPYRLEAGGQVVDLTGSWHYQVGAVMDPLPSSTFFQYQPGGLFKGMVAPLLNYAIKGVIWYQGESNVSKASQYAQLFPAVIENWRQYWQQTGAAPNDFPFLYVQLANYLAPSKQPTESDMAVLREAQLETLSMPNTGMAVAIDIGEWNDIHPLNKRAVGERLALSAQRVAYGDKKVVASGPIYESMRVEGNRIILTFKETGSGLVSKNGALKHFAIAGTEEASSATRFTWANAKIQGNNVVVWSDHVAHPVAVRYAWADNPEGANLYNKEGLPASPFEAAQSPTN